MNREAINYVIEAEARVEELRERADKEIKTLEESTKQQIEKIDEQTSHELKAYRKEQLAKMEAKLEQDKASFADQVKAEAERYTVNYRAKKDTLANRIAEEVLRRYGHS